MRALIGLGFALATAALIRAPGHWGGQAVDQVFGQYVYDAAAAIGAALCLWRAATVAQDRAVWSLISLAFVLEVAGNTVYAALYGAAGGPVPSAADVFWVAFYLPMAAALALRVRAAGGVPGAVMLDVLIAGAALGSISAAFAASGAGGGSLAQRATALAYPVGDLVLAVLVLQMAAANAWRLGRAASLMAGCFVVWAVTDTVYATQVAQDSYVVGGVVDLGWIFPFVLLGAAAWLDPDAPMIVRRTPGGRALVVPVGFAVLAIVMVVAGALDEVNLVAVALAATALTCVVARFGLVFRSYLAVLGGTRLVLEAAHDPFMSFDEQGLVTDWNSAAEASFGWTRQEVLGRDFVAMLLPEERREAHRRHMSHFLATGEDDVLDRRLERTVLHRDGRTIPVELTVSSHVTDYGHTFSAFLRDITARREVEIAKGEFVSIVSHELRTPLTSIRGSLGLLASGVLESEPAKAERMLEVALENTDRLVRLVNDMLDIERIESGTVHLARQACDAGQLVHDAADAMSTAAMLAGVDAARPRRTRGAVGRPRSHPPDLDQPDLERDQVLARRRHRLARRRRAGRRDRLRRARRGPRHPAGQARADLRALPAGRLVRRAREGRYRPRAGDLPQHRRAARRAHLGREHRAREHVPVRPAGRAGDPVAADCGARGRRRRRIGHRPCALGDGSSSSMTTTAFARSPR